MPKMKTTKAAAKRFKSTGTGKLKRNKAYKSHILTKKSQKRKRNLRKAAITDATNVKNMKKILPFPADKLLYAELYQAEDRRRCAECGAAFASTSNSVKYCPDCRKRITRRQAAERMRKRRARVTQ